MSVFARTANASATVRRRCKIGCGSGTIDFEGRPTTIVRPAPGRRSGCVNVADFPPAAADAVAAVMVRVVVLALDEVAEDAVMRRGPEVVRDLLVHCQGAVGAELHPDRVVEDVLTERLRGCGRGERNDPCRAGYEREDT